MIKNIFLFTYIFLALTQVFAQTNNTSKNETTLTNDVVNKNVLTTPELMLNGMILDKSYFDYRLQLAIQNGQTDSDELRLAIRDELYNRALLLEEAKQLGFTKNKLNKIIAQEAQDNIYIELILQEYFKKNPITDQDLKNEYDRQIKELAPTGTIIEYHLATITLSDESTAKEVFKKVRGNNFAQMAKEYSNDAASAKGGDIGWINYSQIQPELKQLLGKTTLGHIIKPIQIGKAWYVVQLIDRREGAPTKFEESTDRLRSVITQQRRVKYLESLRYNQQNTWSNKKTAIQ
jgi:peptidyl-prolyl cis-trans isomerase C